MFEEMEQRLCGRFVFIGGYLKGKAFIEAVELCKIKKERWVFIPFVGRLDTLSGLNLSEAAINIPGN